ncbi:MAG: HEPN domain-containing protein [Candidatus Desulfofervidus auxilii]|nr:HEPN domain-containing protein [Candidatus Desulfofervidus auxilii]
MFHSQQAVEKYLKAFLTYHNKHFGKTHNIPLLIDLCKEIDLSFEALLKLDFSILFPIGVTIRYPIDREITEEEAKEALEISEKVREFILKKLGLWNINQ